MENLLKSIDARLRQLPRTQRRLAIAGAAMGFFFLLLLISPVRKIQVPPSAPQSLGGAIDATSEPAKLDGSLQRPYSSFPAERVSAVPSASSSFRSGSVDFVGNAKDPQIAYSADLSISTKEFAHSRASLEEILDRHHGYVAKLRMLGQPSGSVLNATLRIPSSEYRSTLTDLKAVGNVEREEESADEVTQQYNNFEARLLNAQSEERRLQQLLDNRTPKFTDYTPVERQIAQLRAEMQGIEAQRNAYASPVAFANISLALHEERTAPADTLSAQIRSAAVSGFGDVLATLSTILLFVISRGPSLFLWTVLLYLPLRFFWRRRALWSPQAATAPKTT
jgi:hypothetical protein